MKSLADTTWTSGLIPVIEPDIVTDIIARISDLALVMSRSGKIMGVLSNPNFKARFGLARWEGHQLCDFLAPESVTKFENRLAEFLLDTSKPVRPVELNHFATEDHPEFPVRYSFHNIGTDGTILLLGQDLRPVAEMQQQLVAAQIALEKDYEAQREYDTRLRVLMAAMSDGALFISARDGQIEDCNPAALALLGRNRTELIDKRLSDFIAPVNCDDLTKELARRAAMQQPGDIAVVLRGAKTRLTIGPTLFRTAGEQMLLCRMAIADGTVAPTTGLSDHLSGLFENGADAVVFINQVGAMLSANDAFLRLTNVPHAIALKDRPLSDFLGRGTVDLNVMCDNATRTGAMRLYATRLLGEHGTERPVEISTTHIATGAQPVFAMVIRDASRAEAVRKTGAQVTDVDSQSVVELIGSHTLKGIIAKTTDVIEKMCIETAVELTSNNRVAAAEMLGLSRQSLYVKLRKYDLLKKIAPED